MKSFIRLVAAGAVLGLGGGVSAFAVPASGSWTGPWSGRVARQIDQLHSWLNDEELPLGVRAWAANVASKLRDELAWAREREAERGY